MLTELEAAERLIARRRVEPQGRLRLILPVGFGLHVVLPLLAQFVELHPELTVDTEFSNREVDLVEEGLDVAIHWGESSDPRLMARRLFDMRMMTVAAPHYLARHGTPRTPEDLVHHRCIDYYFPDSGHSRDWQFNVSGRLEKFPTKGALRLNNAEALLRAAIHGMGIANISTSIAYDAVRTGRLQEVLRDYSAIAPPVWILYVRRSHVSPRVRVFVDFITTRIEQLSGRGDLLR